MCDSKIKVIGIGGCGINAVNQMLASNIKAVEFMVVDSDTAALATSNCSAKLAIGNNVNNYELNRFLQNADMLFIVAGLGGQTGAKLALEIAKLASNNEILTIALIVKPMPMLAVNKHVQYAVEIATLTETVDSLICIDNNLMRQQLGGIASIENIYATANLQMLNAVKGLSDLINQYGWLNFDFYDVHTVLKDKKQIAALGIGCASGANRALKAMQKAISSPLLANCNLKAAKSFLININSDRNISMGDIEVIGSITDEMASDSATVLLGAGFDDDLHDEVVITIIAIGL